MAKVRGRRAARLRRAGHASPSTWPAPTAATTAAAPPTGGPLALALRRQRHGELVWESSRTWAATGSPATWSACADGHYFGRVGPRRRRPGGRACTARAPSTSTTTGAAASTRRPSRRPSGSPARRTGLAGVDDLDLAGRDRPEADVRRGPFLRRGRRRPCGCGARHPGRPTPQPLTCHSALPELAARASPARAGRPRPRRSGGLVGRARLHGPAELRWVRRSSQRARNDSEALTAM